MSDDQACQALPREEVAREFMDRNRPRSEQEWWAIEEITHLRAIRKAAARVCWFDWSENDDDAVATIAQLRALLDPNEYLDAPPGRYKTK